MNKEKKRFFIHTFGCQMNVHDSERAVGLLAAAGWEQASQAAEADLVFFNTCAVREKAESKLYTALGRLRQPGGGTGRPRPVVAVGGCVAQLQGSRLIERGLPVDVVVGPRSLHRLPDLLEPGPGGAPRIALDSVGQNAFERTTPAVSSDRARSMVTVMEGCNQVCSFCVVPRTRGTEVCKAPQAIVAEVRDAVARGVREVLLLGQTVNAYRWQERDFASLLGQVAAVEGLRRLRFATSHPRHVTPSLIDAFGSLANLSPHLHLPVQSGSDRILRSMRRGYTRQEYTDKIAAVRARNPAVAVWSDIIVGYPGERDEDFQGTLDLVRSQRFEGLFCFTYSPRPGTSAFRVTDDVPLPEKQARLSQINELQQSIQLELNSARIGLIESVLIDGIGRDGRLEGRTRHNRVFHCEGPVSLLGKVLEAEVTSAGPNSLGGRLLSGDQ